MCLCIFFLSFYIHSSQNSHQFRFLSLFNAVLLSASSFSPTSSLVAYFICSFILFYSLSPIWIALNCYFNYLFFFSLRLGSFIIYLIFLRFILGFLVFIRYLFSKEFIVCFIYSYHLLIFSLVHVHVVFCVCYVVLMFSFCSYCDCWYFIKFLYSFEYVNEKEKKRNLF